MTNKKKTKVAKVKCKHNESTTKHSDYFIIRGIRSYLKEECEFAAGTLLFTAVRFFQFKNGKLHWDYQ